MKNKECICQPPDFLECDCIRCLKQKDFSSKLSKRMQEIHYESEIQMLLRKAKAKMKKHIV